MPDRGRPLIKLEDLPEGWEDTIINLSKEGASIVEDSQRVKLIN